MKRYTKSHEWIDDDNKVGITDHAITELGDVVYLQLPTIGKVVEAGSAVCVVESTKAVVDVNSPASGKVVAVNTIEDPSKIDGSTWLFQLEISTPPKDLLSETEYKKFCG